MAKKIDKTNILLENIVNAIQKVKGNEIISLDLRKIDSAICKYFVICTGTSNTHVNAIEGSIKKTITQDIGEKPWHVEGKTNSDWILLDYINVVGHVFYKETRTFYDIEELWSDAERTNIQP